MAIDLQPLQATLRLQSDQFRAGMAAARQDLSGLKKSFADIGKRTTAIGKTLTLGVTLPIVAATGAAVKFASDQAESINKVNEVFGDNAKVITDWSKTSAQSFGLSRAESLEAAGTLGNLFKGVGIANDELPAFSQNIVQTAADLGSFNNVDPSQVLEDLRSGLVGEAEPLRKYGILLNEATVKQKAMELGLVGANGELTEAAKVQARYALILEQTGDAQGDFARTSDGLANKSRILRAQLKDLAAQFGEILLPFVTKLANALGNLLSFFQRLPTPVRVAIFFLAGLAAVMGPLLIILGSMASGISALAGAFVALRTGALAAQLGALAPALLPLLGILAAAAVAVGLFALAWRTNFLGIRDRLTEFSDDFMDVFDRLRDEGFSPTNAAIRAFGSALEDLTGIEMSAFFFNLARIADILTLIGGTVIRQGIEDLRFAFLALGAVFAQFQEDAEFAFDVLRTVVLRTAADIDIAFVVIAASIREGIDILDSFGRLLIRVGIIAVGWADKAALAARVVNAAFLELGEIVVGALVAVIDVFVRMNRALNDFATLMAFIALNINAWTEDISTALQAMKGIPDDVIDDLNTLKDFVGIKAGDVLGGIGRGLGILPTNAAAAEGETGAADIPNVQTADFAIDLTALETLRADIANVFVGLRTDVLSIVEDLRAQVAAEFAGLRDDIPTVMGEFSSRVVMSLRILQTNATTIAFDIRNAVVNEFVGMRNDATTIAEGMNNQVTNAFVGMRNSAVTLAASLVSGVLGQLSVLPGAGFGVGQSLGLGIASGIRSTIGTVAAEAASLVSNAITAARIAADASSPSRMMMALGNDLAAGLGLGIAAGQREVSMALAGLVTTPAVTAAGMGGGQGGGMQFFGTVNVNADDPMDFWAAMQRQKITGARAG